MDEPQYVRPDELTPEEFADALWLAGQLTGRDTRPDAGPETGDAHVEGRTDSAVPSSRAVPEADSRPDSGGLPPLSEPPPGRPVASAVGIPARTDDLHHGAAAGVVRLPVAPALHEPLLLERALRPLRARTSGRDQIVFDEEATAQQAAEYDLWVPMLRTAAGRPWAEAVVVTDDSPSMGLWQRTTAEFTDLLAHLDAFETLRTAWLATGPEKHDDGAPTAASAPASLLYTRAGLLSPHSLSAPADRRLVLVLTDGLGPAWRSGTAGALLHRLARTQSVAVVHLLPRQYWRRSSSITTTLAGLTAGTGRPGNAGLRCRPVDPSHRNGRPEGDRWSREGLPVPVLELSPGGLGRWARLVAGRSGPRSVTLPVMWATPFSEQIPYDGEVKRQATPAAGPPTAEKLVQGARGTLSPAAFRLAVGLASVPLQLPVIQLLQRALYPESRPHHLSELVASGLLRYLPGEHDSSRPGSGFPFDFRPGVRELLLARATRRDTERAVRLAIQAVPLGPWTAGLRFLQAVFDGQEPEEPTGDPDDRESMELAAVVLHALSGPFLAPARRARAALGERGAPEDTAAALVPAVSADMSAPDRVVPLATPRSDPAESHPAESHPAESVPDPTEPAPADRQARRAPSLWGGVPPRSINFTGREAQLSHLTERLGHQGLMQSVEAVTGMGGVGKTQLALEYAYRSASSFDLVWWIRAQHPGFIMAGLHELAKALHLPLPPGDSVQAAVPQVLEALRTGDVSGRWLLVFDNAESVAEVRPFLPLGGPGSVLVTTRNPQWGRVARTLELDVLPRAEAVALLLRSNPQVDAAEADLVADALGDLPLALEQASFWLRETGMPVHEYLRLFEERRSELLAVTPLYDHEVSVSAAWRVALDRVKETDPSAWEMLGVLSWLAPEPVPRALFSRSGEENAPPLDRLPGDPLRLGRAVRLLNRHSLLRVDHRTSTVQMHRLVSSVVASDMSPEQSARTLDSARLLLAGPEPGLWLTPHLLVSRAAESTDVRVRTAILEQVRWLAAHDAAEDAAWLARVAYDAWSALPDRETAHELTTLFPHLNGPDTARS